ncbi:LuxR C-terminal-related transcriptional regulator [Streptomyces avermitilis]|uniref:HTH luxR-type domain-containing protein n=1 Tax=Streptomyces avermitilis TaxID=33903 RepID=A0A4D4MHE8_STRAX|nr:LuxR C-terminal-related transcriptional regulator [Streptomyces avermitilis]GDY68928.1 hypothetical protein SAV14893_083210 [Streptomyces avermitilis]GDY70687.1 hypothetical protein SAV31267_001720 [Streptomyces avermitilis]
MWQPQLTDHELASLRLLARGHTHTQIAAILRVSAKTAGRLLYGARLSLHARTLPHAVAIGYKTGVLGRNGRMAKRAQSDGYRAGHRTCLQMGY